VGTTAAWAPHCLASLLCGRSDRAEDIYRIVSHYLKVPLTEVRITTATCIELQQTHAYVKNSISYKKWKALLHRENPSMY